MSDNNQEVLLRVEHLCQYFKKGKFETKAVDDVSFDIKKGEVFGLVGESGCGKTTTGRSIIKIYDCTSGNVYFKGQRICAGTRSYREAIKEAKKRTRAELKEMKEQKASAEEIQAKKQELDRVIQENREAIRKANYDQKNCDKEYAETLKEQIRSEYEKKLAAAAGDSAQVAELKKKYREELRIADKTKLVTKIQMIFQDPIASLNPRMTVREIISEGLVINGIKDKAYIDEKVYEILEMVGLVREHAGRYPHEFSGGQRQRIGIARSVIMKPDMLIADEPISALDVSIQAQIINLLENIQAEMGLSYIFIAHDLAVVKHISDRILVMYLGRVMEIASCDDLYERPLHPYTQALLSAIPVADPTVEEGREAITVQGEVPSILKRPSGCPFHNRCPKCTQRCKEKTPQLHDVGDGHMVACPLF